MVRLVISLHSVVLQERTKTEIKAKAKVKANIVEEIEDADDLCAMISECNLVGNPKKWFLDTGSTRYICSAKEAFATYTHVNFDENLFMGNTATARIAGTGSNVKNDIRQGVDFEQCTACSYYYEEFSFYYTANYEWV